MVEEKMANNSSHKVIKFNYKRKFPFSGRSPSKMAVWKQVRKFKSDGTLHNLNKGRSGRKRSVLADGNLALMNQLFEDEKSLPARQSRSSCRKHNLPIQMSKSSFNRTVKLLHYFHPYKLQHRHILNLGVKVKRVAMARHVVQKNTSNPNWFAILWISDEAVFFLNGHVNSKNIICYSERRSGLSEDFTIVSTGMKKSWAGQV